MKTGIEHVYNQFETMAKTVEEWLAEENDESLEMSIEIINYLEGVAFAALMAHKENENDIDIAVKMSQEARVLRNNYYEKLGIK